MQVRKISALVATCVLSIILVGKGYAHIIPLNRYEVWLKDPESLKTEAFEEVEEFKANLTRVAQSESKAVRYLGVNILESGWRYRSDGNIFVPYITFETSNNEILERIRIHYGEEKVFRFYSVSNYPEPIILYDTSYLKHLHSKEKIEFSLSVSSFATEAKILNRIKRLKEVDSAEVVGEEKNIRVRVSNDIFTVSNFLTKISRTPEIVRYDVGPQRSILFEDLSATAKYYNLTLKKDHNLSKMLPDILKLGVLVQYIVAEYNIVAIEIKGPREYIDETLEQLRRLDNVRAIESTQSPRSGSSSRSGGGDSESNGSSAAYCVQIF